MAAQGAYEPTRRRVLTDTVKSNKKSIIFLLHIYLGIVHLNCETK